MNFGDTARVDLTHYRPYSPAQSALRDRFLDLCTAPAPAARTTYPAHFTAGVLILSEDRTEVLLNLHRKAKIWVHFGGHIDPGETLLEAATREAYEESGLETIMVLPQIAQLSAHEVAFCHPQGPVDHLDVRYLATAPRVDPVISAESLEIRWFPVGAVPTREAEVVELISRAVEVVR